jgi:acetoacetyl-CoA synthetase
VNAGEPEVLWTPDPGWRESTRLGHYTQWLGYDRGRQVDGWADLWQWSVEDLPGFWSSVWDYFGVRSDTPYQQVLGSPDLPGARWFEGARLNYARHLLADTSWDDDHAVAVVAYSQTRERCELTFGQLRDQVTRVRAGLIRLGVGPGDRVCAYLPNIPETLIAFLATASLGAVWASCAPEFGARSVIDRFGQLEPTVLLVVSGYTFGAKEIDRIGEVAAIRAGLPTVKHLVQVPYGGTPLTDVLNWDDLTETTEETLEFEPVPFDHPLYVLFSSGTTGTPKAIVHGHGGILLEHLKNHAFSWDLGLDDVERAGLGVAGAGLDRDDRRQSDVSGSGLPVAGGGRDPGHGDGGQPGVPDGQPQGGGEAGAGARSFRPQADRLGRQSAAGRGIPLGAFGVRPLGAAQRRQRGD